MEDIFVVEQESLENKQTLSCSQKNNAGIEKDNPFTPSECELDCEHITSKHLKRSRRCSQIHNSCPCTNHLILSNSIDFTSTSKRVAPLCIHSAEFGLESLRIFCRKSSLLSIPACMTPTSSKFRNFKQRGRAQSIHSLTDFLVECSPAARSGNLVPSPSTRWAFDSIEATLKARNLMKSSVIFRSVSPGVDMINSISISDKKSRELMSSHSGFWNTTLRSPKAMVIPRRRQRSEINISQEMPLSCSSSNLASLYQSNSSAVINSAFLHCVWEGGYPYFVFSMGEDQGNVYMATPHRTKSSVDKALDYIYLFHTWNDKKRESKSSVHASNFVGTMKVRSSLLLTSSRSKFVETEFILSAANKDSSSETQRFSPSLTKSKGLSSKLSEIFRGRHYSKSNSIQTVESSSQSENLLQLLVNKLGINDETGCTKHPCDDSPHNLELAAIVVQDFEYESKHGENNGGWGLKFLGKVETDDADSSQGPPSSSARCNVNHMEHTNTGRNVNVLLPAGFHGVPITGTGGPSSLTERWKSNGHCDCGGWDIGCPLTVLNNNSIYSKGLLLGNSEEDCKSVNLFKEGAKLGEPTFKMFSVSKDLYVIYFLSTLSVLQSFSIAVANIHSQTPDLYPKW